jgi:hypothetical protein
MKLSKSFLGVLIGSALLLANDALAANKGTLHVSSPENVAGQQLTAGEYTVRWESTGPAVQLRIMQAGKVVVALPARIVALDNISLTDAAVIEIHRNGSRNLSRMYFSGQRFALEIETDSAVANIQTNN